MSYSKTTTPACKKAKATPKVEPKAKAEVKVKETMASMQKDLVTDKLTPGFNIKYSNLNNVM